MEKKDALFDGGTIIYKSELKDATIIVCNTLEGNKDIYIGDYQMNYTDQCGVWIKIWLNIFKLNMLQ